MQISQEDPLFLLFDPKPTLCDGKGKKFNALNKAKFQKL